MSTTVVNKAITLEYNQPQVSVVRKFMNWCGNQESNRLMWLGIALAVQGCVLTPLAFLMVAFSGGAVLQIVPVMFAMALTLIPNLAAQSTKITIPLFLLSIAIDLIVISSAIISGLDSSHVYSL